MAQSRPEPPADGTDARAVVAAGPAPSPAGAEQPGTPERPNPSATDLGSGRPSTFEDADAPDAVSVDLTGGVSIPPTRSDTMTPSDIRDTTTGLKSDIKSDLKGDASRISEEARRVKADSAVVGDDLVALARETLDTLQRVADELATQTAKRADRAVGAVKDVGQATVETAAAAASDARHRVENGVETLSHSVSRNPLTAVAIAAGIGMLLGLMNRSSARQ